MCCRYYELGDEVVRKETDRIESSCSGLLASKELLAQALRMEMLKERCSGNAALCLS